MTIAIFAAAVVLGTLAGIGLYKSGFLSKPRFIRNYELDEYSATRRFIEPLAVKDGLAIYSVDKGKPILVFPYPHADTTVPMAQGSLSRALVSLGRRVITFDVPGAYRSTRDPRGNIEEMLQCARETLQGCGVQGKIDVIGHSMGSLCALGFSIEHPESVNRLILVGGMAGFPAAIRWGMPGSCWKWTEGEYWTCMWWGIRMRFGRGNLELHKRLSNLMGKPCFHDKSPFTQVAIDPDDRNKGVPIRYIWLGNLGWKINYASRLAQLQTPTLICVGRYDPETPLPCSEELRRGIPDSRMVVFERSGHMPFIEERDLFLSTVNQFLAE
jgi:pimeloyl-ACP methyl ester carboxylesterase